MKKIIAAILALVMILALAACGAAPAPEKKDDIAPEQNETEVKDNAEVETETAEPADTEYTIADEVLVDNADCSVIIKSAEVDEYGNFAIKVLCENKTSDKTLMFYINDSAVNGYMVNGFLGEEIAAGKKSNATIDFYQSDLEECGITSADKVEFVLKVTDSDDWMADPFVEEQFVVYPTGLTEDEVVIPARPTSANEVVVVDNADFTFVILGETEDYFYDFAYACYIENKTGFELMVSLDDVSVNGFMIDPYFGTTMTAGNRVVTNITFSDSDMEANDIEAIENIEYTLYARDYDNWFDGEIFCDTFTYEP